MARSHDRARARTHAGLLNDLDDLEHADVILGRRADMARHTLTPSVSRSDPRPDRGECPGSAGSFQEMPAALAAARSEYSTVLSAHRAVDVFTCRLKWRSWRWISAATAERSERHRS